MSQSLIFLFLVLDQPLYIAFFLVSSLCILTSDWSVIEIVHLTQHTWLTTDHALSDQTEGWNLVHTKHIQYEDRWFLCLHIIVVSYSLYWYQVQCQGYCEHILVLLFSKVFFICYCGKLGISDALLFSPYALLVSRFRTYIFIFRATKTGTKSGIE